MISYEMVRGENKGRRENQGNFGDGQGYGKKRPKRKLIVIGLLVISCAWLCPVPHQHSLSYSIPFYIFLSEELSPLYACVCMRI